MNAMTTAQTQDIEAPAKRGTLTGLHTALALAALMVGLIIAGIALMVAAVAVPVGLLVQAILGDRPVAARRGWQPVAA